MRLEERVRAAIAEERTVTEQSLGRSARRLRDRRDALHGVRDGLNLGAADIGVIEVADAALALEAAVEGVRSAQGHLRRLGSSAEFERRLQRTRRKSAEGDGTTVRPSGGAGASCPSAPEQIDGCASRVPRDHATPSPRSEGVTALVTGQDEDAPAAPRRPQNALYAEGGTAELSLLDANLTLDAKRNSLRGAAGIVAFCPDAGEADRPRRIAAGYERAAERALCLDRNWASPQPVS